MLADLDELRGMNARRKEAMAAQVIFTNACTMDEYVDDFEHFEEREVRYSTAQAIRQSIPLPLTGQRPRRPESR